MRMPMTCARGAITIIVLSALTAISISCASDKPSGGQPNPTCEVAQTLCNPDAGVGTGGSYCANLQTETANCGDCGHQCAAGWVCTNGRCDLTCATDETLCGAGADGDAGAGSYCANTKTDNANCGCCGNACGPNQACREGRCDEPTTFGFFVFGDMHIGPDTGSDTFNATVQIALNQMTQIDANAMAAFSNGDEVNPPADAPWTQHNSLVSAAGFQLDTTCGTGFGAKPRYFATVGDQDCRTATWDSLWNKYLPAQQNLGHSDEEGVYYSVKYANAYFVMLDSEHVSPEQTDWLKSTLASADAQAAQLKFVFAHQPIYSCVSRHSPFSAGLPWVDLAEQHGVNVFFGSHTHTYTRTCPKYGGKCTSNGTGIIFVETGAVGGDPRAKDIETDTVPGKDAAGNDRTDAFNCIVGEDLKASHDSENDFCHVRVDGCTATVNCYVVGDGNKTPFDTWTVNGCGCDPNAGQTCDAPTDGGTGS